MRFNKLVPELYCSDFERSLRFYTETLGFAVRYARPEERFAFLDREGAQIMIEQAGSDGRKWLAGELAYPYGRGINLEIEVSDVASLYSAVVAAGCRILVPLEDKWYRTGAPKSGNRQFVVLDPDGYLLRFAQDLGEKA